MFIPWFFIALLIFALVAVQPRWNYSREWGNVPSVLVALAIAAFLFYIFSHRTI